MTFKDRGNQSEDHFRIRLSSLETVMRILRFTQISFLSVSHANSTEETIGTPSVQRCAPEGSKAMMIDLESHS